MTLFRYYTLFASSVLTAINVHASDFENITLGNACPIPTFPQIAAQEPVSNDIKIYSKQTSLQRNMQSSFTGGVTLISQTEKLTAEHLLFDQQKGEISATGDIHFQNNAIDIFAQQFSAQQQSEQTQLSDSRYQLVNNPGHGHAGEITISASGSLSLHDSSFTTCYGQRPAWAIYANEISFNNEEEIGQAYGATFRAFDIPIMYVPYFSFPITDKRKSGFLAPSIGSSSNSGIEVATPYYWNIAENFDATITPHYMSKRGLQMLTEFRYLSGEQSGSVDLEYLQRDNDVQSDDARYLARFQHTGTLSDNFRAYVDFTTISDDNYLVDIGSKQYNSNDAYLYQVGELAYFADNWSSTITLQDFEVLGTNTPSYKTLPQIDFNSAHALPFSNAIFDIYSELTRFKSDKADIYQANRYHVEAGLSLPFATPAWYMNSEVRLLQTNYQQDIQENLLNTPYQESVSRTLPKVRFHGGVNFDRPMYFNPNYTQTLEPQLQYLYIPEQDQSMIGLYDTTQLQDDYNGLFRDRRYSGLDRVAQANQLSWGLTTRMLNAKNTEKLRFSFGQIIYFADSNIVTDDENISVEESALAADILFQLNNQWQFSGDLQYDTQNKQTNKSQVNIDYLFSKNTFVQLNHRFTRSVSSNTLEQLSLLTSLELNESWQFVGRATQDLEEKRSLETYAGLQYQNCCWAVQMAYHRHINSYFDEPESINDSRSAFDSGFMIKFILTGLNKNSSVNTKDMLNSSIFGYKQPYFLNN